jgi:hypothetical protein
MNPTIENDDAGDAITADAATPATQPATPTNIIPGDTTDTGVASVASVAELTALADSLEYTITVGQAVERFVAAKRKPPSTRSIQRYCVEGQLAAQKIRTIFGAEWLINERALARLIESEPIVTGDASVAVAVETASPAAPTNVIAPNHTSDEPLVGVASVAMATPIGERRTIAEVLIENARLLAQVEGRDAIITELKEDRSFLREEVREGRRTRDDVKNIAERMLDTLRSMAIGRSIGVSNTPSQDPVRVTVIDSENQ